jgi:hypothetical protein
MGISDKTVLEQAEIDLFKREKGLCANVCKLLLHYSRPDGIDTRHQYIYEDTKGELRNFVFVTSKDNVTIPYLNCLGEILTWKDSPVSASMEPLGPEIKLGLSSLNK